MVWTGDLTTVAMGDTTTSAQQEDLRAHLRALGRARADHVALRRGRRVPLLVTDDLYVFAWAYDADPGELAVVAVNRGAAVTDLAIDALTGAMLGTVAGFDAVAGAGSATLDWTRLRLTLGAGDAVVLSGR